MSTNQTKFKLARNLLTFSAAGILLASQAFAQDQASAGQAAAPGQENPEFRNLDQDQDQLLLWREIHVVMDPQILAAGLDQERIFQQYDENKDDALDQQEFDNFVSGLQGPESGSGQTAMDSDEQQPAGTSGSGLAAANGQNAMTGQQDQDDLDVGVQQSTMGGVVGVVGDDIAAQAPSVEEDALVETDAQELSERGSAGMVSGEAGTDDTSADVAAGAPPTPQDEMWSDSGATTDASNTDLSRTTQPSASSETNMGTAGMTDTAGTTGTAKTTGTARMTGTAGTRDTAGTTGVAGTTGTADTAGTTGVAGTTSTTDTAGMAGTAGARDTTGTTGVAGTTGTAGTADTAGTTGVAGTTGTTGTTDTAGMAGTAGTRDTAGTTGVAGTTATTGTTDTAGMTGTAGNRDTTETTGTAGTDGVAATGAAGAGNQVERADEIEAEGSLSTTSDYEEFTDTEVGDNRQAAGQASENMGSQERSELSGTLDSAGEAVPADTTGAVADVNEPARASGSELASDAGAQPAGGQDISQASVDSVKDKSVLNSAGETLGKVNEVVVDGQTGDVGLVISSGGILGMGATKILVPVDEVNQTGENLVWDTEQSKKELKNSAKYQGDDKYQEISDGSQTLGNAGSNANVSQSAYETE